MNSCSVTRLSKKPNVFGAPTTISQTSRSTSLDASELTSMLLTALLQLRVNPNHNEHMSCSCCCGYCTAAFAAAYLLSACKVFVAVLDAKSFVSALHHRFLTAASNAARLSWVCSSMIAASSPSSTATQHNSQHNSYHHPVEVSNCCTCLASSHVKRCTSCWTPSDRIHDAYSSAQHTAAQLKFCTSSECRESTTCIRP